MNKVKYLAFFVPEEKANSRNITPSSNAKVDYLIEALNNSNFEVELFSACSSRGKTQKKETFKINNNIFHLFFSQYSNNKLIRGFFNKLFKIRLYLELKKNLSKCDTLVVYHSLYYMKMVRKL